MITCQPCPLNFGSPIGSTSVSNCTCAPGFVGPAGGPCTPCPSGTYKKDTGSAAACTPCPVAGQWSATRSVDAAVYLSPRRACLILQRQICNITSYHITCINRRKQKMKGTKYKMKMKNENKWENQINQIIFDKIVKKIV